MTLQKLVTDDIEQNALNNILLGPNAALLAQMERMNQMMAEMATRLTKAKERDKQRESNQTATSASQLLQTADENDVQSQANERPEENEHMCDATRAVNDTGSNVSELNPQTEERVMHNQYSVREIADVIPKFDPTKVESVSAENFVAHVEIA